MMKLSTLIFSLLLVAACESKGNGPFRGLVRGTKDLLGRELSGGGKGKGGKGKGGKGKGGKGKGGGDDDDRDNDGGKGKGKGGKGSSFPDVGSGYIMGSSSNGDYSETIVGYGQCLICDGSYKIPLSYLALQYFSQGADSQYQTKAECRGDYYPFSTVVTFSLKTGGQVSFSVSDGDTFLVPGPFGADTEIDIIGYDGPCSIHTSCSQPLVAGDRIGPFQIVGAPDTGCPPGYPTGPYDPPSGGSNFPPVSPIDPPTGGSNFPPVSPNVPFDPPIPFDPPTGGSNFPPAPTPVGPEECVICDSDHKIKLNELVLRYTSDGGTSRYQSKATCVSDNYPASPELFFLLKNDKIFYVDAEDGMIFSIYGDFNADTWVDIEGYGSCKFHTSCSQPIVQGDRIGPFEVIGAPQSQCTDQAISPPVDPPSSGSGFPQTLPPQSTPQTCVICDGSNKIQELSMLELQYFDIGQNSNYQTKATCLAGNYPPQATLMFGFKNGDYQMIDVFSGGPTFAVEGDFDADTFVQFFINGVNIGQCSFHTSCSEPLVQGDQIGPFKIIGAPQSDCSPTPPPPPFPISPFPTPTPITSAPVDPPTGGSGSMAPIIPIATAPPTSIPSANPSATPTLIRSLLPTAEPTILQTQEPSPEPTPAPFPEPTPEPSPEPTPAPFPEPTPEPSPEPTPAPFPEPTLEPSPEPTPAPFPEPTPEPSPEPTPAQDMPTESPFPSPSPTETPTAPPSHLPTSRPIITLSEMPSPNPTHNDTPTESPAPSPSPTATPTKPPADLPCIYADAETYSCGDAITIDFNFDDAYIDDWIGIYPCEVTEFRHSEVWQWTCGEHPDVCPQAVKSGTIVFDSLPPYNIYGPHSWPVAPFTTSDGTVSRCFKAVLLRNDGASVPPYFDLCETQPFTITENASPGCEIRDGSHAAR